jgi:nuclear transport factor 2 (NTF2) superfamily protein
MASLKPPFTTATAHEKVKFAQGMWNTCDPAVVSKGYTPDCIWRNRTTFIQGTDEIISFLTAKWKKEQDYRLRKELFAVSGENMEKIAVQFWYEYRDAKDGMKWKRCYGLEDWTFDVSTQVKLIHNWQACNL